MGSVIKYGGPHINTSTAKNITIPLCAGLSGRLYGLKPEKKTQKRGDVTIVMLNVK